MKFSAEPEYRPYLWAGLAIIMVTAWFSVGYNHPDEHFQILEFCNYKLGLSRSYDLPWEFDAKCRTAIQPFLAYCICKPFLALGCYNPFIAVFLLRLFSGIFAWWVTCRLVLQLLPTFTTQKGKDLFVYCSLFLWYIPYLYTRFSAENLSGQFFFLAVSLILGRGANGGFKSILKLVIAGLLLGFVVFIRLQMAFALVGLAIWLLFVNRLPARYWAALIVSGLVAMALCVLVDYWFYGSWQFTPYNYFHTNIVEHVAEKFGVFPWYYYVPTFIESAIPHIGLVLVVFYLCGVYNRPFNLFALASAVFILGHSLIGHKEMRFLFPMSFAFIYLVCVGYEVLAKKMQFKAYYNWGYKLLLVTNFGALAHRVFAPAQESVLYFEYLYKYAQTHQTTLVYFREPTITMSGLNTNFYKSPKLTEQCFDSTAELSRFLDTTHQQNVLCLVHDLKPGTEYKNFDLEKLYCFLPTWVLQYNPNNWQDRSHIWTIYKITKKTSG